MPIDDLTALGQKMRKARKNKELTQQELSDLSHVSVKQIANIENQWLTQTDAPYHWSFLLCRFIFSLFIPHDIL